MTKAQDIINTTYQNIGVLGAGKTLGAYENDMGLTALRDMLANWSFSEHKFHYFDQISKSLSSGYAFTIGKDGTPDWDNERPEWIDSGYTDSSGVETPLKIIGAKEYDSIGSKAAVGPVGYLYYEREYPNGILHFFPAIDGSVTVTLRAALLLSDASNLDFTDTIDLPKGYNEPIIFQLSRRLAPRFGRSIDPDIIRIGEESTRRLSIKNAAEQNEPVRLDILKASRRYRINED